MVLVTGASGFIGSHLVDRLALDKKPVRVLVRRKTPMPPGVQAFLGDLRTGEGLAEAVSGVKAIIHVAGVTKALKAQDFYDGNARASRNLARAAAVTGCASFIHVSSLAVSGPSTERDSVTETDEPRPISHYGKSKLQAEDLVRDLLPHAIIVRPPVVYGPRDTGVLQLLKSVSRGLILEIAGGERWLSMIYVHDLVDGLLAVSSNAEATGRTYFMAHPRAVTWKEIGMTAADIMGQKPRTVRVPVAAAYALGFAGEIWSQLTRQASFISREKISEAKCGRWVCDSSRVAAEIGFEPSTSLREGLAETIAWYKETGWLKP